MVTEDAKAEAIRLAKEAGAINWPGGPVWSIREEHIVALIALARAPQREQSSRPVASEAEWEAFWPTGVKIPTGAASMVPSPSVTMTIGGAAPSPAEPEEPVAEVIIGGNGHIGILPLAELEHEQPLYARPKIKELIAQERQRKAAEPPAAPVHQEPVFVKECERYEYVERGGCDEWLLTVDKKIEPGTPLYTHSDAEGTGSSRGPDSPNLRAELAEAKNTLSWRTAQRDTAEDKLSHEHALLESVKAELAEAKAQLARHGAPFMERIERAEAERDSLRAFADRACVLGMAAIATYGRRDGSWLTGLSLSHWNELAEIRDQIDAALQVKP